MWVADKVEKKNIDALNAYSGNSRVHTEKQIKQIADAISEWGWTIPILIDESNTVLAGHGRLLAAKLLNISEVPCIVADGWTEAQKKAYVIADNKLAENSEWDMSVFYTELRSLSDMDFDLTLAGFDADFSALSFEPNLDPSYTHRDVSDDTIARAEASISDAITGIQDNKANNAIEVLCPYCAETFRFSGV